MSVTKRDSSVVQREVDHRSGLRKEILCTLGPASLNGATIARLTELGVSLFRINLSHTSLSAVPGIIEKIREYTTVPICLDSEGAQIRTGRLASSKVTVRDQAMIHIHADSIVGDSTNLSFYPQGVTSELTVGNLISIDFNSVLVQVVEKRSDGVIARVLNGGEIGQNKAVTVLDQDVPMPPLTQKDVDALRLGAQMGIKHVALSFANEASDVDEVRKISLPDAFVISKIECRAGLINLREIAVRSDALLIDRGDLSRQIPIERIPGLQKTIIRTAKSSGRKVYVATNLLESMITSPTPTRAEVNDIYNTLLDGADGLVMAAETAIGKYAVGCVSMVVKLIHEFERDQEREAVLFSAAAQSMLVEPHGGPLVQRELRGAREDEFRDLKKLAVSETAQIDCEHIATGAYSPLTGFMDRHTLDEVLAGHRLPGGAAWTMPIVLQVTAAAAGGVAKGERVALTDAGGTVHSVLDVSDVFAFDFEKVANAWFGTTKREHPGVARLAAGGTHFVGGEVTMVRRHTSLCQNYELSPAQSRAIFTSKGWSKIVGFHTHNVLYRVHEHIQLRALEESGADGLYISPVAGPRTSGDWTIGAIMKSYQLMVDCGYYPRGKVVLGAFVTYPRHCGPREAVFAAICEKNMGCSHFIVGRDQSGSDGLYPADAKRALFDKVGDIGITPLFFDAHHWDAKKQAFQVTNGDSAGGAKVMSGAQARQLLRAGSLIPDWFLRPEIQDLVRGEIEAGRPVFVD